VPDDRRNVRGASGGGVFGNLLNELIGTGFSKAFQAARQMAPKCGYCGEPTIIKCQACGQPVCHIHAFINAKSLDKLSVVCSNCMAQYFPFVEVAGPGRHQHGPGGEDWPYKKMPWEILGIERDADEVEVNEAFRQKAKKVHPDRAKDEPDRLKREKAMKTVTAAREWMLHHRG
jgi:hypothetical protein